MHLRRILAAFCMASALLAQTAAGLRGVVRSSSGSPLSGVEVRAFNDQGRETGVATTDAAGAWELSAPAGTYRVAFRSRDWHAITIKTAAVPGPPLDVKLTRKDSGSDERAVVYRPVVDTERTDQADFLTNLQLSELPINGRNYLSLAALTPGVAAVNDYVGITDAPLVQAPQSGLSFGGNNGRGNVFWLDGGENYINTGGVRPSISEEAIAEFQVDRGNYSAEFGGGIGGIVNIISKSGSNAVHGDVFEFLRLSPLEARNYFFPRKQSDTWSQAGGTIGGPLRRNKTYFYLGFERLDRQQTAYVAVGQNRAPFHGLSGSQQKVASFLQATGSPQLVQLSALTNQLLITDNFPITTALFQQNGGMLPFSSHSSLGSARIDHRFSDNHNAFLRFNASAGNDQQQIDGFNGYSRGVVTNVSDQTMMVNDTRVFSARLVSESRFSMNRTRFDVGNRDRMGPSIDIARFGYFGKNWLLPADSGEWHLQGQQNFFYSSGRHSIRLGADINPVRAATSLRTNSGGRFVFDSYLPLGGFYSFLTHDSNTPANIALAMAQSGNAALIPSLATPLSALQSYNIGAPGLYIQDFAPGNWNGWFNRFNFFFNDVIRLNPRLTLNAGIRYEVEHAPSVLGFDPNNLAPRLGLAWDVTGDRRTVLRAGYGLFYLRHQTQIAAASELDSPEESRQVVVPLSGLPGSSNPATGLPVTSADIYQTLLREGIIGRRPIVASDLSKFGIVPAAGMPFGVVFQKPANFVNAYSEQASFEIERALGGTALSLAYNFTRGAHLPRLRDLNAVYGPPGPLGLPTIVPRDPLIGQSLIYESGANSFYHALIVQATRRYRGNITLDAHYTFSKSIDEATDIDSLPDDSLNTRKERALSTFDQRHRLVASAVLRLPGKFTLSPILVAASGHPFNVVTGQDLSLRRPVGAGRNIGRGPAYFTVDMRVSRSFQIPSFRREGLQLELIAESFNLLNRTNFRRLNNVVDAVTVNDLPRPVVGVSGPADQPLSFVSAYPARQIQLALKIRW